MERIRPVFEKLDSLSVFLFNPNFAWWLIQYKLSLLDMQNDDEYVGQTLRNIAVQKGFIPPIVSSADVRTTWEQH